MRTPKLTYANVMSTIAVFLALGGTSYAAVKLGRGQVKTINLATGSVTSAKVKDGSLLAKDFKQGVLLRGATGEPGLPGAPGAPGAQGAQGPKGDDGMPLVRMTQRAESATVDTTPQVVAQIGPPGAYSGAYSTSLRIPAFDSSRVYYVVIVTASARFSSVDGTSCDLQASYNDGQSFASIGAFSVVSSGSEASGSTSVAIPVFTPGTVMRFQLACRSNTPRTLTTASIGAMAGSL